jgi:hypothetical protein
MRILTNRGTVLVPMVAALTELVCGKQGFSFASRGEDFDAFARSSDPLIVGIRRIKLAGTPKKRIYWDGPLGATGGPPRGPGPV